MTVKQKRVVLVDLSDTHAGSKYALMSPESRLYDEDERGNLIPYYPELTASQKYLWDAYLSHIAAVKDLAGKDEIVLIHNGDLTHGIKYPQGLVSSRLSDQVAIAVENLSPWFAMPNLKATRLSIGTGAHNVTEGATEILATQVLKERFQKKNIEVLYHGILNVNDCYVDYAHHGPYPGSRKWLEGNVAKLYLKSLMYSAVFSGLPIPDIVLRAHYHHPVVVKENMTYLSDFHESTLVISPSYSMLGDHGTQATQSTSVVSNGIYAIELFEHRVGQIIPFVSSIDIRTEEKL